MKAISEWVMRRKRTSFIKALQKNDTRAWQIVNHAKWPAYIEAQKGNDTELLTLLTQFRDEEEIQMTLNELADKLSAGLGQSGVSRRAVLSGIGATLGMAAVPGYAQQVATNQDKYKSLALKAYELNEREGTCKEVLELLTPFSNDTSNRNSAFFNELGLAHRYCGNLQAAISSYQKAIELDSRNVKPRINLAYVFKNLGDSQSLHLAAKEYQAVVAIDPSNTFARNQLKKLTEQ